MIQIAIAKQIRNKTIRPVNRIELKMNQLNCIGPLHSSVNKGIIKKWLAELVNLKKLTVEGWDFSDPTLFKNSIYLEDIFLESSIGTVASNMFACLKNVRDLTIQEGYIKFVPDSLNGLQNLVNLCISAEGLTTIPEGLFKGLNNLTSLELSYNQELDFLPEGLFEGLINLTSLNLGFNSLSTLPEGLFEGLINLEILDLESNSLCTLPEGIFEGLGKLELIKLSGNLIENITKVAIPPNVRIEMDTNIRRH
jgi:Leucine-rich repeat (LRR) protein